MVIHASLPIHGVVLFALIVTDPLYQATLGPDPSIYLI